MGNLYQKDGTFLNYCKNSEECRINNNKYIDTGQRVLDAGKKPHSFQAQIKYQLSHIQVMFRKILENLMTLTLGKSIRRHFLRGIIDDGASIPAVEIGMIEAMLQIHDNKGMLRSFEKIQFAEFTHEAHYFFQTCRMVEELVDSFSRDAIINKLSIAKASNGL